MASELQESPIGRAHRRLHNVWLHHVADRMRLQRQSIAVADGLDPDSVEHYPIKADTVVINGGAGWLPMAGLTVMLLSLGALAGVAGWTVFNPPPAAAPPAVAPTPVEFQVEFFAADGKPIEVQPTPVK